MCPVCVQRSNGTSCQWEWYEVLDKENGGTRFKESNLRNVVHVQMAGTVHQVRVGWAMVETLSEIRQIFKVHNDHNMTIRGFPPKTVKVRCAKGSFNMMRNMRIAKKFRIIRCGRVRGIRYSVVQDIRGCNGSPWRSARARTIPHRMGHGEGASSTRLRGRVQSC